MLPRILGFQGFGKKNRGGCIISRDHLGESFLKMFGKCHFVLARFAHVHQIRKQIQTAGCLSHTGMTIKLLRFLLPRSWEKWSCGIIQLDRNSWCLLINAVHNVARYIPVSCVARQNHESTKPVVDETLHSLEI